MLNIDEIIAETLKDEGGYSNHVEDRGGATRYGITEAVARSSGYTGDMRELGLDLAINIYKSQYWLQPKFSQVAAFSDKVAMELFDTGVNCSTGFAQKALQECLNLLNQNGKLYANLVVDGGIGQKTLDALSICLKRPNGENVVLKVLNGLQFVRYKEICERREDQEKFMWGWVGNRVS